MERLKFEECRNCKDWTGCMANCFNTCGKPLDALEEFNRYKDLEEQGKLLKLPVAVGDTVYRIRKGRKNPITPMQVICITIRNENELVIQTKISDFNHELYSKDSIGKTVFLTIEAAETALK